MDSDGHMSPLQSKRPGAQLIDSGVRSGDWQSVSIAEPAMRWPQAPTDASIPAWATWHGPLQLCRYRPFERFMKWLFSPQAGRTIPLVRG